MLQYIRMSHTLTIRLTDDLLDWLKQSSRESGIPMGQIIREQLEKARSNGGSQKFLHHIGALSGPPDLSSRKGYSRK